MVGKGVMEFIQKKGTSSATDLANHRDGTILTAIGA